MNKVVVWLTEEQAEYMRGQAMDMAENEARFKDIEMCVEMVHALDEALEDAKKRNDTEV